MADVQPAAEVAAVNAEAAGTRPRGRPRSSPAAVERRRQQIIEAAYEVFAEKGYHAAGIADIASRLDIGHGTFYRYFENKRAVLDHVFDYALARFLRVIVIDDLRGARSADDLRERMTAIGTKLFDEVDRDPRLPRMILLELTAVDAELLERVFRLLEKLTAIVVPLISDGMRRGYMRADLDPESVARATTGCLLSGLFAMVHRPLTLDERSRYVQTVVALVCDGPKAAASSS